jgi:hypothetical protein
VVYEHCKVVYDMGASAPPYGLLALITALCAAAICFVWRRQRRGFWPWASLVATFMAAAISYSDVYSLYTLKRSLATGDYITIKGIITEYDALRDREHGPESFIVDGMRFRFYEGDLSPGYHKAQRSGSGLMAGSYVRIASTMDSRILRLEVCEP